MVTENKLQRTKDSQKIMTRREQLSKKSNPTLSLPKVMEVKWIYGQVKAKLSFTASVQNNVWWKTNTFITPKHDGDSIILWAGFVRTGWETDKVKAKINGDKYPWSLSAVRSRNRSPVGEPDWCPLSDRR